MFNLSLKLYSNNRSSFPGNSTESDLYPTWDSYSDIESMEQLVSRFSNDPHLLVDYTYSRATSYSVRTTSSVIAKLESRAIERTNISSEELANFDSVTKSYIKEEIDNKESQIIIAICDAMSILDAIIDSKEEGSFTNEDRDAINSELDLCKTKVLTKHNDDMKRIFNDYTYLPVSGLVAEETSDESNNEEWSGNEKSSTEPTSEESSNESASEESSNAEVEPSNVEPSNEPSNAESSNEPSNVESSNEPSNVESSDLEGSSNIFGKDKGKAQTEDLEASGTTGLSGNPESALAKDSPAFTTNILEEVEEPFTKATAQKGLKRHHDSSGYDNEQGPAKRVCTGVSNTGDTSLKRRYSESEPESGSDLPDIKKIKLEEVNVSASFNSDNTVSQATDDTNSDNIASQVSNPGEETASQPSDDTNSEKPIDKDSNDTKPEKTETKDSGSAIDYIISLEETTPIDFFGPDAGD